MGGYTKMPYYAKNDQIRFTGEASAELFGVVGIVIQRRTESRHYVYDIKISVNTPNINVLGVKLSANGLLTGVPADWIELLR
jgi:hypothetical protein